MRKEGSIEIHMCANGEMGVSIAKRSDGDQANILKQAQIVQNECAYWGHTCPENCEIRELKRRINQELLNQLGFSAS